MFGRRKVGCFSVQNVRFIGVTYNSSHNRIGRKPTCVRAMVASSNGQSQCTTIDDSVLKQPILKSTEFVYPDSGSKQAVFLAIFREADTLIRGLVYCGKWSAILQRFSNSHREFHSTTFWNPYRSMQWIQQTAFWLEFTRRILNGYI